MKKYSLIIIVSALLVSCQKYLDKAPELGLSDANIFNNFSSVQGYLDQTYNSINDFSHKTGQGLETANLSQISDETANARTGTLENIINKGIWLNNTTIAETGWGTADVGTFKGLVIPNAFYALRIANRVIEKAPLMSSLSEDQKNDLLGQAHFFRAWFYFEIIRRIGGMPLMDKVFNAEDNFDQERLTYQQSSDWAIAQLDEAIKFLPDEWSANETGRVNKVAAYALKSMIELYAASPLMHNPVGTIENNGYDIEYCKKSAEYAKQTLDYIEKTVPKHKMMPGSAYKNIFYHSPNFVSDESLFYINSTGRDRTLDIQSFWQNVPWSNVTGPGGVSQACATQNMVDLYETKNGYPVKLVGSTWVTADPAFNQTKPFDRDPRFGMTIILPGEQFGTINNNPNYLCTWEGGRDVEPARRSVEVNLTRYSVKKWQWPSCVVTQLAGVSGYGDNYYNCIIIRTTQVWLDYAEAMNEAYGPTDKNGYTYSALDAINMVRARVGMSPVRSEYTSSKEIFRDRIRNERAVELMFENHRWFDLRRWMIAEAVFNPAGDPNPIKGVKVTASAVGKYVAKNSYTDKVLPGNVFSYQLLNIPTEIRVFQKKHYWYPIGKDEANRYSKLKQNPGW